MVGGRSGGTWLLETFIMTSRLLKTVLFGSLSALLSVSPALAIGHHRDSYVGTSYVTSSVVVPTSYVTSSYLVPSSYVDVLYPTVYSSPVLSPTVYVEPTAYVVTGRRSVERPIYTRTSSVFYDLAPTTYVSRYLPTTTSYELPLLTSTSLSYTDDCVVTTSVPVSSRAGGGNLGTEPGARLGERSPGERSERASQRNGGSERRICRSGWTCGGG